MWVAGLWLCTLAAMSAPVAAQDAPVDEASDRRARLHFDSATAYFETGDYESALREFRASYAEAPRHVDLLYNIFLCEERLGNLGAAVEALETYLAEGRPENRATLEQRLANLRERAARGDASVAADDPVDEPTGVSDPGDGSSAPSADPTLAIVGFTIAGAGLVSFAVAGGITLAEDASLSQCAPSCSEERVSTLAGATIAADISAGVALAGAVLGVIGLIIGADTSSDGASVRLRGTSLEGRF